MTPSGPTVSVIVPTYNHSDFVGFALDSVFAQSFSDNEAIVVNDASPDDTHARLRPLAEVGRIRYVANARNEGQARARNRGLALARGEFVALLDDDDEWPPDKLQWQVDALRAHPDAALVYGTPAGMDEHGLPHTPVNQRGEPEPYPWQGGPSGDVYSVLARKCFLLSPGQALIRRSALIELDEQPPFDPSLWGCDDWDLWVRLAERRPFVFVDRPALRYRFHGANASRDAFRLQSNFLLLYRKHRRRNRGHAERSRWLREAEGELRENLAVWWLTQAYLDARTRRQFVLAGRKALAVFGLGPRALLSRRFLGFLRGARARADRVVAASEGHAP